MMPLNLIKQISCQRVMNYKLLFLITTCFFLTSDVFADVYKKPVDIPKSYTFPGKEFSTITCSIQSPNLSSFIDNLDGEINKDFDTYSIRSNLTEFKYILDSKGHIEVVLPQFEVDIDFDSYKGRMARALNKSGKNFETSFPEAIDYWLNKNQRTYNFKAKMIASEIRAMWSTLSRNYDDQELVPVKAVSGKSAFIFQEGLHGKRITYRQYSDEKALVEYVSWDLENGSVDSYYLKSKIAYQFLGKLLIPTRLNNTYLETFKNQKRPIGPMYDLRFSDCVLE